MNYDVGVDKPQFYGIHKTQTASSCYPHIMTVIYSQLYVTTTLLATHTDTIHTVTHRSGKSVYPKTTNEVEVGSSMPAVPSVLFALSLFTLESFVLLSLFL
eukprot:GHVS01058554.1.p1 GENE.GHVS01058554.1~~GHVS01058554.1.p1  ORF type:complete len:112 (-),score=8.83 GHVS01058554.1:86-388(-)